MRKEHLWVKFHLIVVTGFALSVVGCNQDKKEATAIKEVARPVFARSIGSYLPTENRWVTGSVAAWKTEKAGFEVGGRVQSVVEPDQVIQGRVLSDGKVISTGTPLARLNSQRYQISLQKAESAVKVASRKKDSLVVQIEEAQKASLMSALARQKLAEVEYRRAKQLFEQNASSRSQFDQAKADYDSAVAATENTRAQTKGSRADLLSMEAEIEQAVQNVQMAELDLQDTVLYSEFRGVVSEVHVVPGSLVRAGDPVVTVQMMDPMKIEFEVSAKAAKKYRRGDIVQLFSGESASDSKPLTGFVYSTDPVADQRTRTFTVTLLARNPATKLPVPQQLENENIARTEELWPINVDSVIGSKFGVMIEQSSVHKDAQGYFLWKAMNRSISQASTNRIIEVKKIRVQVGPQQIPFFNWIFRPVRFAESDQIDPQKDLFVGALRSEDGPLPNWDGKYVIYDQLNWQLLPGDVVKISLSQDSTAGTYVPFESIRKGNGQSYIFVARNGSGGQTQAQKVLVDILGAHNDATSGTALCKIQPTDESIKLNPETQIITEGVHYLADGETIKIISRQLGEVQ